VAQQFICGMQPLLPLGTAPSVEGAGVAAAGGVGATLDVGVATGVGVVVLPSNAPPPIPAANATAIAPPTSAILVLD